MSRRNLDRFEGKLPAPYHINVTKGSVHIVAVRDFVEYVIHNRTAIEFLDWVKDTYIPDETFFSSLNHNPHLRVPGSYLGLLKAVWYWHLLCLGYHMWLLIHMHACTHAHTLKTVSRLSWILSGTTWVSRHQKDKIRKGKTNLDLLEQEIVSGSGITQAICKSAPWPRHNHSSIPPFSFYRLDALPAAQPAASKHWRQLSMTSRNPSALTWHLIF